MTENHLLPPNSTQLEKALSETVERINDVQVLAKDMWDPASCPVNLLPWLAWALSVDEWNPSWTEQQKRETIASSFKIHESKGTLAALKASLAALGYETSVTEWFELPNDMDPYTFTVDIDAGFSVVAEDVFDESKRLINQTKNTRSHLTRLRVSTNGPSTFYTAAAQIYGIYCATGGTLSTIETVPPPPVVVRYFAIGSVVGFLRVYKVEGQSFTLLPIPDVQPSSTGSNLIFSIDFGLNADYMAVACTNSPRIYLYKRNGDAFTKLPNPALLPTGTARKIKFSPDGDFLAVAHSGGGASVYQRSGDTFTRLASLSPGLQYDGYSTAWNRNGDFLAISSFFEPPQIYARSGSSFSKIADPAEPLPNYAHAMAFSPVSDLLVCAQNVDPFVTVSIISEGVHIRLPDPDITPLSSATDVAFSPTGSLVAVAAGDNLYLYEVDGVTLTRIPNPVGAPTVITNVAFNHTGTILTVVGVVSSSVRLVTYSVSGTTLTQISNPPDLPSNVRAPDFSN